MSEPSPVLHDARRRLDTFVCNNLSGDYIAFSREEARGLAEDFDWHVRGLEMVRRMATFGPGPETSAEQALGVIRIWAEKRLAKLATEPVCPRCDGRGEVPATPGQPGDGPMPCVCRIAEWVGDACDPYPDGVSPPDRFTDAVVGGVIKEIE